MILYLSFSGQDIVLLQLVDPKTFAAAQLGQYDFQSSGSNGFVEYVLAQLHTHGMTIEIISGIIVEWSTEARFTVSRLTGVFANTFAMAHKLPIIAQASNESLAAAALRLQKTTTISTKIEYSAEPRIVLY